VSSEVSTLLDILGDGEWHGLAELQRRVGLVEHKMREIAAFLCRFDFAVVDEVNRRVKVNRDFREFLARS
jgi:hypothetical protein